MNKIAVLTVVKNEPRGLEKTLKSIREVKANGAIWIEYILVDGLSTQDTLQVIEANRDIVDVFISEEDSGLYDAMNKSARLVSDNCFMIWINAGDIFLNPDLILKNGVLPTSEVIFCGVKYPSGEIVQPKIKLPYDQKNFFPNSTFRHQGFFIKRDSFFRIGGYDCDLGMQADGALMSRAILDLNWTVDSHVAAIFDLTGMSLQRPLRALKSYIKIWKKQGFMSSALIRYHWWYLAKLVGRVLLPLPLQRLVVRLKRGRLES